MTIRTWLMGAAALTVCAGWCAGGASAQCDFLAKDTFRLGPRPHGGSGQIRDAQLHDGLRGYWPQSPPNVEWSTADQTWFFAAASLDPQEVDPQDVSNGVAFVGGTHAAALLPFSPPGGVFTMSIETALGVGQPQPLFFGVTSSSAVTDNFQTQGALWTALDGSGNWAVYANGSTVLVSGSGAFGDLATGWVHIEVTYDPAAGAVSGRFGGEHFGPLPVALTLPMHFVGFEAHDNFFNAVNNFIVRNGGDLTISASAPATVPPGGTVQLSAATNAVTPYVLQWRRQGFPVADGPTGGGSAISGSASATLTISNVSAADAAEYDCVVSNACGSVISNPVAFSIGTTRLRGDMNCDGVVNNFDIDPFVLALTNPAGYTAAFPNCNINNADINGDGVMNNFDIDPFVVCLTAGCP